MEAFNLNAFNLTTITGFFGVMFSYFGDCKPLRDGVQELKIDIGPGYRVYLSRQGPILVLLLCGGDKGDQSRDIERAIEYLKDWKQRGKP